MDTSELVYVQKNYLTDIAICYGCGPNHPSGLHIKTLWDGQEGVCRYTPGPEYTAYPGMVYGGLIACIMDCHALGTAVAAWCHDKGVSQEQNPDAVFFTGQLNVTYLKPTPLGTELLLRARATKIKDRKVMISCSMYAGEIETARAEVVAVRAVNRPETHPQGSQS